LDTPAKASLALALTRCSFQAFIEAIDIPAEQGVPHAGARVSSSLHSGKSDDVSLSDIYWNAHSRSPHR